MQIYIFVFQLVFIDVNLNVLNESTLSLKTFHIESCLVTNMRQ